VEHPIIDSGRAPAGTLLQSGGQPGRGMASGPYFC